MAWSDCGLDSNGRPIGYIFDGKCDHDGCDVEISRGLSNACGYVHGENEFSCEKYFCDDHKANYIMCSDLILTRVCISCFNELIDSGEWFSNNDDVLIQAETEIKYTENNLEHVLNFVGMHQNFRKWFPSYSDYVQHVKKENGLFKIINAESTQHVNIGDVIKIDGNGAFIVITNK